jgi:DNA/RNA-binding domain of Phe-tRNA-synthetase-like protein
MTSDLSFEVSSDVTSLGIKGAYFLVKNLKNGPTTDEFRRLRQEVLAALIPEVSSAFVETDNTLRGFRELHDKVGASNKKHASSPENLARTLIRTGGIPEINLLVDIYNLVSIQSRLAIGAHDVAAIHGNVALRRTTGTEKFLPLGSNKTLPIPAGEYAYVDDSNEIICRLEVRQVEKTKINVDTKDCFYIIQGNERTSDDFIWDHSTRLIELTERFCGGEAQLLKKLIA